MPIVRADIPGPECAITKDTSSGAQRHCVGFFRVRVAVCSMSCCARERPRDDRVSSRPESSSLMARMMEPITRVEDGVDVSRWRDPVRLMTFAAVSAVIRLIGFVMVGRLSVAFAPGSQMYEFLSIGGYIAAAFFVIILILALLSHFAWHGATPRIAIPILVAYLVVATLNVFMVVTTLVFSARLSHVDQTGLIIDLCLTYVMMILLFSLWYQLADVHLPGGAVDFPENGAKPDCQPIWFDYLFLSFNTSSTFGPTLEGVRTRPAKALMMVQTAVSLLMLIVVVARIVQAI